MPRMWSGRIHQNCCLVLLIIPLSLLLLFTVFQAVREYTETCQVCSCFRPNVSQVKVYPMWKGKYKLVSYNLSFKLHIPYVILLFIDWKMFKRLNRHIQTMHSKPTATASRDLVSEIYFECPECGKVFLYYSFKIPSLHFEIFTF